MNLYLLMKTKPQLPAKQTLATPLPPPSPNLPKRYPTSRDKEEATTRQCGWEGGVRETGSCIYMGKSLCRSPETLTTSSISHPPIQNKRKSHNKTAGGVQLWQKPHTHGWVTHKLVKYFITEVLPPGWKLWALHQAPQPGGLALGGGAPKAFGFEGQWV